MLKVAPLSVERKTSTRAAFTRRARFAVGEDKKIVPVLLLRARTGSTPPAYESGPVGKVPWSVKDVPPLVDRE